MFAGPGTNTKQCHSVMPEALLGYIRKSCFAEGGWIYARAISGRCPELNRRVMAPTRADAKQLHEQYEVTSWEAS